MRNGNTGVYAYKSKGKQYSVYYIIDFDEGYVYCFSEGNSNEICERVQIDYGDLNNGLVFTYHDGGDSWSYGLHFNWKRAPDHLILQDQYGFEYDFYSTDLDEALRLKGKKTIKDY